MSKEDILRNLCNIGLFWLFFSFLCLLWSRRKKDNFKHLVCSGLILVLLGSVGGVVPNALLSQAAARAVAPGLEHTIRFLSNIMLIAGAATGSNIIVHAVVNK